jgi:valyl-tRNA synthetase
MAEISNRYDPADIESKWYQHWEKRGYFHSEPDGREPFSIVIPPPNVTGILHMGHMLNNTIQDALMRKARLEGKNACWVPGTDHASIATEAKVVRWLREEKGLTKGEVGRERFIEYAWEWTHKYGGIILKQLRRLGASCDWERTAFTMDDIRSEAVIKIFVDLYRKGKLYRRQRMVNWDPDAKTVLSNEEVIYREENGHLYHVKYPVVGREGSFITIATTRPETILADTALAVHPQDERYSDFEGAMVSVPLIDRHIPIIYDEYVDREFGTGALKITPAHDPNDYEIGLKHNLEIIDILEDDGRLNERAQLFIGQTREEARKSIQKALDEEGYLEKVEDYRHSVGRSERTKAVVEPKLSLQWYVDMPSLAKPALDSVMEDIIKFYPKAQKNTYRHWMENIRDWCVSRQLWWGHRIPAWYCDGETFVAENVEEALEQARQKFDDRDISKDDLRQDEDVLDTWFSSWLWPITVFDGFNDSKDFEYYYPTSVLVTAWDIIFLWVARMIMAGYEWKGEKPFKDVYFTGMVRDKLGRKMSKSLGNSPDAIELMDQYGADGVRFGMLSCSPAGGDLLYDDKLCEQGRNFCNKIWNALRLVDSWEVEDRDPSDMHDLATKWIENRLYEAINELEKDYAKYRLADVLMKLYTLIWDDFCSWYLEMIKPARGEKIARETRDETIRIFESLMIMLHPFMPFITEEVWHRMKQRAKGEDCMVASYPEAGSVDKPLSKDVAETKLLIRKIREIRQKYQLKNRDQLLVEMEHSEAAEKVFGRPGVVDLVISMCNLLDFKVADSEPKEAVAFHSGTYKFFAHIEGGIDADAEKERLQKELEYAEGFVRSVRKKLDNERFVNNAPESVVEKERRKLEDGEERIKIILENLNSLKT